jgi:hypothetical protein
VAGKALGKAQTGTPSRRWENNIKIDFRDRKLQLKVGKTGPGLCPVFMF